MFKLLGRGEESYITTLESIIQCISRLKFRDTPTPQVYACAQAYAYGDVATESSGGFKKHIKKRTKRRTTNKNKTRKRRRVKRKKH